METKSFKKLTIHKMSEFLVIREKEQMILRGGYSVEQMEEMMNNGSWTVGQVDGLGYVKPEVTVYGDGFTYWDAELIHPVNIYVENKMGNAKNKDKHINFCHCQSIGSKTCFVWLNCSIIKIH